MPLSPEQRTERAKKAAHTRWANEHDTAYYANLLEQKITEVVDKAGPLSDEQIERLRGLLTLPGSREVA